MIVLTEKKKLLCMYVKKFDFVEPLIMLVVVKCSFRRNLTYIYIYMFLGNIFYILH